MAGTLNVAVVSGRFVEKPEMQEYKDGAVQVVHTRIASNYSRRVESDDGEVEWVDEPEYHNIEIWGSQAKFVADYGKKGYQVTVQGRLKTEIWEDERYKNEEGEPRRVSRTSISAAPGGVILHRDPRGDSSESEEPAQTEKKASSTGKSGKTGKKPPF